MGNPSHSRAFYFYSSDTHLIRFLSLKFLYFTEFYISFAKHFRRRIAIIDEKAVKNNKMVLVLRIYRLVSLVFYSSTRFNTGNDFFH